MIKLGSINELKEGINSIGFVTFIEACFLFLIFSLVRSLRFHLLLKNVGITLPIKSVVRLQIIGGLIGIVTPGKIGEGTKNMLLLKVSRIKFGETSAIFMVEKLSDLFFLIILSLPFLSKMPEYNDNNVNIFLFAIIVLITIFLISYKKIELFLNLKFSGYSSFKKSINLHIFILSSFFTILSYIPYFAALWLLFHKLDITLSLTQTIFLTVVPNLIAVISLLPGGTGAREASGTLLAYNLFSIPYSTAFAVNSVLMFAIYATYLVFGSISYFTLNLEQ
jgi:uncharacterized membrane protein YbhN (UPF0104 family)